MGNIFILFEFYRFRRYMWFNKIIVYINIYRVGRWIRRFGFNGRRVYKFSRMYN